MARIRSRRADGAPSQAPSEAEAGNAEQPTVAVPAQATDGEQPTTVVPAGAEARPDGVDAIVPASAMTPETPEGADPADDGRPGVRSRAPMRRRLRYLRRVREVAFRDLGGLVYDLDRFGRERPDLVRAKLDGLRAIDAELRTLEEGLGDLRDVEELREAGIAACAHCGTIHDSAANFCPSCGVPAGTLPAPEAATEPARADAKIPGLAALTGLRRRRRGPADEPTAATEVGSAEGAPDQAA